MIAKEETPLAIITVREAKEIISGLISDIVSEELKKLSIKGEPLPDSISTETAVSFLKEQGYPITKGGIYNKICLGTIPYKKVGKRLLFSRTELLQWLNNQAKRPETNSEAVIRLANSVKNR